MYDYDLGRYTWAVTSGSSEAQRWFDRGMVWCYGYNHEEAIACFERALAENPSFAMAYWGIAYASGPNYNYPWALHDAPGRAAALARAYDALRAAVALAGTAGSAMRGNPTSGCVDHVTPSVSDTTMPDASVTVTPAEAALIGALAARYPQRDPVADLSGWDVAFADAMREVHCAFPDDPDIAAIHAEAMLNLTPWRMWDLASGRPAPNSRTAETRAVLEAALARPGGYDHPGLTHLYVHLMEMSPHPEVALKAADRLRTLVPDAGHLVHMPTHIDVLCGAYHDVLHWNLAAIAADEKFAARAGRLNFYTGYRIHNYHFAVYGAMFLGRFSPALAAAEGLTATVPESFLRIESPPMADFFESFWSLRSHVFIRFGKWREAVAAPLPADPDLYRDGTATVHYARGVAHAAQGEVDAALHAQEAFHAARARVPDTRLMHNNRCVDLLAIAAEMLAGEIEYRRGNFAIAFDHLRRSVHLEDTLPYDEPWGWMQPTRHALGALLLERGEVDEAEAVYRSDLGLGGGLPRAQVHPDNIWALRGLLSCLERRDEVVEASHVRARLDLAAARADDPVGVSCFCARGAAAAS